jgi:catechol 2,3-dioxygenase-like lactoylglutathione lyase family enzyme
MPLHRITDITIGVPNVDETASYYEEFGLIPAATNSTVQRDFETVDGGRQLRIVKTPTRRLVALNLGADDPDDLERIARSLTRLDIEATISDGRLSAVEPVTGVQVTVAPTPHLDLRPTPTPEYNSPGIIHRANERAPWLERSEPVRPRRLGHVVVGSTYIEGTQRFFAEGLGFKVSDTAVGLATFLRCSADHHNVLIQTAPVNFLHHTAWEVNDIDEIGRGAKAMLEDHPERHVWGFGRHWVGSNFFYYLRDPAGNFTEYYSDMDEILDDQLWEPGVFGISDYAKPKDWGPPLPVSMIAPDDLAELMSGSH